MKEINFHFTFKLQNRVQIRKDPMRIKLSLIAVKLQKKQQPGDKFR